ncbi:MAG: hypothetical protein KGD74_02915 [Candidatus Lokiarchaeota archaeon]|nr:hypothetical protein [Candidatus Lokiarchaeota archaeon]
MNTAVQVFEKVEHTEIVSDKSFFEVLKEEWELYEINQKKEELLEYKKAYEEEPDKNSFNAQMIETFIYLIEEELK